MNKETMHDILKATRIGVLVLCGLYALLMGFGLVIDILIEPNRVEIELIKTLFEIALWLALPTLVIVLVLKAWRLALAMLLVVLVFTFFYAPLLLPRSQEAKPNSPQLTVMTFNVKTTSEGIVEIIRSADADIVALQELSQSGADALSGLEEMYPYRALHPQEDSNEGQGLLSRYPIEADEYWEYHNLPHTLGHQRVEIVFEETLFAIYNTHPWPPLAWEPEYHDQSHRVALQDVAERAFAEELPVLLVGDFNMTDNFKEYDLLSSRFTDSYLQAGRGIGYTFPNYKFEPLPPILRLDYIWHSNHFESIDSQVWSHHGQSDHSPVITNLILH